MQFLGNGERERGDNLIILLVDFLEVFHIPKSCFTCFVGICHAASADVKSDRLNY